jgi:hypothetical protein
MEKRIGGLPEGTDKETRQENVRILKGNCKLTDNLTAADRKVCRAMEANEELTKN